VEKETTGMNSSEKQARHLYEVLAADSTSSILESADDLLLFLNRMIDTCRAHVEITSHIHAINDIIRGLESNPARTINQPNVQNRLRTFFMKLLKSSNK
jgi:hypothetical protein